MTEIALALLVAGTLLLDVHLPWGGSVPMGYALVIALAELLSLDRYTVVVSLALVGCAPVLLRRYDGRETARRLVWWAVPAASAGLTASAIGHLGLGVSEPSATLAEVLVAGAAFVVADLAVRRVLVPSDPAEQFGPRSAWPV